MGTKVVLLWGQSNVYGQSSNVANLATEWTHLATPYSNVQFAYDVGWPTDGIGGATYSRNWGDTEPQATGFGDFGPELALARQLATLPGDWAIYKSCRGGTSLGDDWAPDSVLPNQLWANSNARVSTLLGLLPAGSSVAGLVWIQGSNDNTEALALAYEANLSAFLSALRDLYGPGVAMALNQLHADNANSHKTTLRAAQSSFAASEPLAEVVNFDDLTLLDSYHFLVDGYAELGDRLGAALASTLRTQSKMAVCSDSLKSDLIKATLLGVNYTAPTSWFVALHTDDPLTDDSGDNELAAANGYARVAVTFEELVTGLVTNAGVVTFAAATGANWAQAKFLSIRTALTAGTMLYKAELTAYRTAFAGGPALKFEIGELSVGIG